MKRRITSTVQRDYLRKRKPEVANRLEANTSPTEFIPLIATRKRRK